MRLSAWLSSSNETFASLARRLTDWMRANGLINAAVSPETVRRYAQAAAAADSRIPRREHMRAIAAVTAGAVTPNDFYEMPAPHSAASGLRARSPSRASQVAAGGRGETPAGGAAKRKRNHSHASKKAWRSRKRRAAARAAAEARV